MAAEKGKTLFSNLKKRELSIPSSPLMLARSQRQSFSFHSAKLHLIVFARFYLFFFVFSAMQDSHGKDLCARGTAKWFAFYATGNATPLHTFHHSQTRDIWKMINSWNWRQTETWRRKIGAKMRSGNEWVECLPFYFVWFVAQLNWWELTIITIRLNDRTAKIGKRGKFMKFISHIPTIDSCDRLCLISSHHCRSRFFFSF